MKSIFQRHSELIEHLSAGQDTFDIGDILTSLYLNERNGKAIIFQNVSRYAVFYLSKEKYPTDKERTEETSVFWDLMALIQYLRQNEYIIPLSSNVAVDKIVVLHDHFSNYKIDGSTIILNKESDFSALPEIINNKDGNIIYQGIVYRKSFFQSITENCSGIYKKSIKFEKLMQDINTKTTSSNVVIDETNKEKIENNSIKNNDAYKRKNHRANRWNWLPYLLILCLCLAGIRIWSKTYELSKHSKEQFLLLDKKLAKQDSLLANKLEPSVIDGQVEMISDTLYGLDISHYNASIVEDLKSSDSIHFVICKATQGARFVDPYFHSNWKFLKDKKFIRGAYHFFESDTNPVAQATHYLEVVGEFNENDITPILDVEESSFIKNTPTDTIQSMVKTWLEEVKSKSEMTPMIYCDYSFAQTHLRDSTFSKYPLWLAEYRSVDSLRIPDTWTKSGFLIWQKTNSYFLDSINNSLDVHYGSKASLTNKIF